MRLNDDDITTARTSDPQGPSDAGAGMPVDPQEDDGGADRGASGDLYGGFSSTDDVDGPMDAGAGETSDPHATDGGADGGAA